MSQHADQGFPPELNPLPPELRALEAELASLVPRDNLDAARAMFLAGRASVARSTVSSLVWPAAFGGMTLAATVLAVLLLARPAPEVIERIVRVPAAPAPVDVVSGQKEALPEPVEQDALRESVVVESRGAPAESPSWLVSLLFGWPEYAEPRASRRTSYPALRDRILTQGLDSWPTPVFGGDAAPARPPLTNKELFDQLIRETRHVARAS